jgi:hypothetical protein
MILAFILICGFAGIVGLLAIWRIREMRETEERYYRTLARHATKQTFRKPSKK